MDEVEGLQTIGVATWFPTEEKKVLEANTAL
jgi:hypothetical protein